MSSHETTVRTMRSKITESSKGRTVFYALCWHNDCVWQGPKRSTAVRAMKDGAEHEETEK